MGTKTKTKVLVIDDEEIVLDACVQILAGGEYKVVTAQEGTLGLERLAQCPPDLVLVDLKMPGLSGFEVVERIHALDPAIATVVITGYATINSAVEAMQKGAFDFISKPFTPDELRLVVRRSLEKRRLILEASALRQQTEMLRNNFAAIVSHEIKAPLGVALQNLSALANELGSQLTPDQQRRLERLQVRLGEMTKMINTWLRILTVDVNEIRKNFQPVAVGAIVGRALENMQLYAERKNLRFAVTVADCLPDAWGDEGTLVEVVTNLVSNAVKYSQPDSTVTVSAHAQDNAILLTVADTGVGIAKDDLPFIFNDFYAGRAAPGAERGSGLGLAISRRIVEAHGGTIAVESELGSGTTFTVRLPAGHE